ncbi:alpha-ketoglutarate-dependent dioxygenase AlkB [Pseudomonas sp. Y39-6]|uniref:alpha-ketoglutarate-dependent dioxygenase AlkB family protein n=1 Tax=Pseudomonas sp. Y39-6 TaxID=2749807 RepID=UPI001910D225|nr:alpha-ketoglutarate-dependent dioxygenase AlkB [Pseudomonas sp. Y39-6]QPO21756.1 alpha-ketoglutarate-dependent dioxygenase AlkB [Pseudomonas sp. Y39-6]URS59015.1 alpha-ketoglutarate-dependent dioxygenase AlkB [Pseudomonas sp. Y39-6]
MQTDLFLARPEDLNLLPSDGVVNDFGIVLSMIEADVIFSCLKSDIAWQADTAIINGNVIETRRQVAWYADTPSRYIHSGVLRQSLPWDVEILDSLRARVEHLTATTFNSCLLNRYEDGTQGMGWHSDSEAMGEHAVIASLSLGGTRKFAFKHKGSGERREMALHHGQLIVMRGDTQQYWFHALMKTNAAVTPRISLTFRRFP